MSDTSHLIDAIRDMLLDCGLFDTLDRSDVQTAAGYFNLNRINEGTEIFSEGDAGTFMCILVQGSVSIRKSNASGDEVEVTRLRRGRAFGEMGGGARRGLRGHGVPLARAGPRRGLVGGHAGLWEEAP